MDLNMIKTFDSEEFGEVRVIEHNGEPWFVGKDVAEILGYANTKDAVLRHVDEEDSVLNGVEIPDPTGRKQVYRIINESGLYSLILSSKLPSAKRFKKWVTSEVLPSIRNHGIYATDNMIDRILENPDFGIKLLSEYKAERQARLAAEKMNVVLMHVNKTYTMTEIAKELNMKSANELNKRLEKDGIQYKVNNTWVMRSAYSNRGFEEIKQDVLDNGRVIYHRRITQLGRDFILNKYAARAV